MEETTAKNAPLLRRAWVRRAALSSAAVLAAVMYVLLFGVSKPAATGFARHAEGALEKLVVLPNPPEQPIVRFTDAGGASRQLKDWRGKVVVVNLWATWCPPCVEEMPTLAALSEAFAGRDVMVVPISVDKEEDRQFAMDELAKLSKRRLSFFHDPAYALAFEAKAQGFPTTIIYSRDGRELARLAGSADWSSPEARTLIEEALAE